jgi:hypothetical protein
MEQNDWFPSREEKRCVKIIPQGGCCPRPGGEQIDECDNAWSDKEGGETSPNECAPEASASRRQCDHENADDRGQQRGGRVGVEHKEDKKDHECFLQPFLFFRHGSNQCDRCEQSCYPEIHPEATQEASSEFIFHHSDCSHLSHWFKLILNHALQNE